MKDKIPSISVVMPVYNAGRHLSKSIESILSQTFIDFEFIIIDDGSKDDSWSVIQSYASRDPRIIARKQENRGVVKTANYATSIARGEFIARTDADDISFSTKLGDLFNTARANPNADVIIGSIEVMDENDEFLYRDLVPIFNEDIKRSLYIRNPIPNGATLIRREALVNIGGFAEVFAEDCHLWTRLWHTSSFRGTGTTIYRWRVNPSGLTMSNLEKSLQKEREYIAPLWEASPPERITRKQILDQSSRYLALDSRFSKEYNKNFLFDLSRVAIHQLKHGHILDGSKQLLSLASTGRSGFAITLQRILLASKGARSKAVKKPDE